MTITEVKLDLENTDRDIKCLSDITGALSTFITQPGGEDRSAFRVDLYKFSGLLSQANSLRSKIHAKLVELEASTPTPVEPVGDFEREAKGMNTHYYDGTPKI